MSLNTKRQMNIGSLQHFPVQIGRVVKVEGREIAVFQTTDGALYAVDNLNPHPKGGPLAEGIVSGHYLYDPLYDWKIDLITGEVQAPDEGQVAIYKVSVQNEEVSIEI